MWLITYQTLAAVPEPENSEMFAALVLHSESPRNTVQWEATAWPSQCSIAQLENTSRDWMHIQGFASAETFGEAPFTPRGRGIKKGDRSPIRRIIRKKSGLSWNCVKQRQIGRSPSVWFPFSDRICWWLNTMLCATWFLLLNTTSTTNAWNLPLFFCVLSAKQLFNGIGTAFRVALVWWLYNYPKETNRKTEESVGFFPLNFSF